MCAQCSRRIYIISLLYIPALLVAQPSVDLLQIRQDQHLPAAYDVSAATDAAKRSLRQYTVKLLTPLPVGRKTVADRILFGGEYANFTFRSHGNDNNDILEQAHFQWLEIHLGYLHSWGSSAHSTRLIVIPKWSTDSTLFTADAFQIGGLLIHRVQVNERLALGAGGFYFRESFGWKFIPTFEVDWRIRNDWYLYGVLPGNMKLAKVLSERFEASASFWGPSSTINATRYGPGSYIRIVEGLYSIWKLDLTWYSHPLTIAGQDANTYVRLSAGYSFDRRMHLYDNSDTELHQGVFFPYTDGPVISITLALRVRN